MARRATGEGSIGKRKDGTYYGTIRLDGKQQWVYGKTRKEASDKLKALSQKHAQGVKLDTERITVGAFLDRWLEEVVKQRNKPRTYESYKHMVDTYIKPHVDTIQLTALRPDHIQSLINAAAPKRSARTVQYIRAILRRALNQAMRWRYISFNPAMLVEVPRRDKAEIQPLTLDEAQRLLAQVKGHRLELLYSMALMLGLRRGEVLGLLFSSINLERGTVRIDGSLQWVGGKLVRDTVKTETSARTLPLPPTLVPLLRSHIRQQRERYPENGYVFVSTVGTPINPRNLLRQFKTLLDKAGIRDIRFHDLRHSCATFLIASGVHPRAIMEILGHSQISTTMNVYGHLLQEVQIAAVNGVEKLLTGE